MCRYFKLYRTYVAIITKDHLGRNFFAVHVMCLSALSQCQLYPLCMKSFYMYLGIEPNKNILSSRKLPLRLTNKFKDVYI